MNAVVRQRIGWRRALRRWRQWLRREAGQAALLVVLIISLVEPFGCLLHCRFAPSHAPEYSHSTSHEHHQGMAHEDAQTAGDAALGVGAYHAPLALRGSAQADRAGAGEASVSTLVGCSIHDKNTDASPFITGPLTAPHTHLAIVPMLLSLAFMVFAQLAPLTPPPRLPQPFLTRQLRPPIYALV
jgi:hypothetical protein